MKEQISFGDLYDAPGSVIASDQVGEIIPFDDVWRFVSQKIVMQFNRDKVIPVIVKVTSAGSEGAVIEHGGKIRGLEDGRIAYADMQKNGDDFRRFKGTI